MLFKKENLNPWEKFADKDPLFYIDTNNKNQNKFWQSGENNFIKYILPVLKKYNIEKITALDFGCGVGRHSFPLANRFNAVYGVDISEKMLEKACLIAKEKKINNVNFISNKDFLDLNEKINFIYSVNVFQHIPNWKNIEKILKKFSKILNGYAYIQFDTRPINLFYIFKKIVPNFLLPKTQKRGIRRIRRSNKKLKKLFTKQNFSIISEQNSNTASNFFLLKKHSE